MKITTLASLHVMDNQSQFGLKNINALEILFQKWNRFLKKSVKAFFPPFFVSGKLSVSH